MNGCELNNRRRLKNYPNDMEEIYNRNTTFLAYES